MCYGENKVKACTACKWPIFWTGMWSGPDCLPTGHIPSVTICLFLAHLLLLLLDGTSFLWVALVYGQNVLFKRNKVFLRKMQWKMWHGKRGMFGISSRFFLLLHFLIGFIESVWWLVKWCLLVFVQPVSKNTKFERRYIFWLHVGFFFFAWSYDFFYELNGAKTVWCCWHSNSIVIKPSKLWKECSKAFMFIDYYTFKVIQRIEDYN